MGHDRQPSEHIVSRQSGAWRCVELSINTAPQEMRATVDTGFKDQVVLKKSWRRAAIRVAFVFRVGSSAVPIVTMHLYGWSGTMRLLGKKWGASALS